MAISAFCAAQWIIKIPEKPLDGEEDPRSKVRMRGDVNSPEGPRRL
ncbi:MAG: hypothetical protein LBU32_05090 [Clostridiales bacterium]|nr:hypothetical protein [Clostridiales bacterium]